MNDTKIIFTTSDLKNDYEVISIISSEITEEIHFKDKKFNYYSKRKHLMNVLENEAKKIEANAVIGVSFHLNRFDNFVIVSVIGTAVKFL